MFGIARSIASLLMIAATLGSILSCHQNNAELFGETTLSKHEIDSLDLEIDISLIQKAQGPKLRFILSFVMPRDSLLISLPKSFLRVNDLYKRIENLEWSGQEPIREHKQAPHVLLVKDSPGKRVRLSYDFRSYDSSGRVSESFSAPIIRNHYFQFVGLMALAFPLALLHAPSFPLTMRWSLPENFRLFTSYGADRLTQSFNTDFDKLRDALFVAGSNMRIYRRAVLDQPVIITLEGYWDLISDQHLIDVVTSLLAIQRRTFGGDFPYFLINLLSVQSDCNGTVKFAGTAHPNSFRAFFPSACRLVAEMKQLISHELMHMWIGKIIRVGKERGHIDGKWFTEGFTDYFGRIMALRAGVITEEEYFKTLNRQLEKYYISPENRTTLSSVVSRMYREGRSRRTLEDIPYQQGEIMAWRLNSRIKIATKFRHSLDDVIRDMLADAKLSGGVKNFDVPEIAAMVDRYAPRALEKELNKVVHGELFIPPDLPHCRKAYSRHHTEFFSNRYATIEPIFYYGPQENSCEQWLDHLSSAQEISAIERAPEAYIAITSS